MNKNKVVKIIKLFVICLITAMFISGDCDGCKNPMKTKEGEEINKGHYFMAAMALRFVTSMTVDKNVVGAGESYKLSWEYPGTDDIIGPESAIYVDLDHVFFIITRSLIPDEETLLPVAQFDTTLPSSVTLANEYPHIDSTSFTLLTPVTKSEIKIYHRMWVTDGIWCGYHNVGGLTPVTVIVDSPIRLAISKSAIRIGLNESYTLSWNRVEGMSGYELEVSEDEDFPPEKTTTIYEGDGTSYTASAVESVPRLLIDYFRVRAVSDNEASAWSNYAILEYVIGEYLSIMVPVTEVKVNEPFLLNFKTHGSPVRFDGKGYLSEECNSSVKKTIDTIDFTASGAVKELIKKEPGIYKYVFSARREMYYSSEDGLWTDEMVYSNPVYVTVLPDIQPIILSVSSSEASYLEDYSFSWNSAGDVDGYEWKELVFPDTINPLLLTKLEFPKQVLSWVCAHRVARDSTFMYRVRSFSLNPNPPPDILFDAWSQAVYVTVHPLQPPGGLAVTGPGPAYGMTSEITWTAVPHADRYRIRMTSSDPFDPFKIEGESSNFLILLDSEETRISHKFESFGDLWIMAQSFSGTYESNWSFPMAVTVAPAPPPVATLSSNQVESGEPYTLDWTIAVSEGLEKFIIEENIGGSSSELEIQPGERSRTFSHETQSALTCTYRIKARYSIGGATVDTDWSDPVSLTINPLIVTPEAPVATIDKSGIQSGESVTISWNAVANATSYELNNITTDETPVVVPGISITVTLTNDQETPITYQFTVTAVNESGGLVARSSESNTVSVDVTPLPVLITPDAPELSVSKSDIQSGESVTLSWNAVDFATVYELNNITAGTTTSVTGTSRTVTLVNNQQTSMTYQFTVTALNETGGLVARSSQSNTVSVEVAPAPIATPEAPSLTIDEAVPEQPHYFHLYSGESATLRWNAVANATSYELTTYECDFNLNRISGPTTTSVAGTSFTVTLYNSDWGMYKFYEYTVTALNESGGQVARSTASNKVYISVGAQ